MFLSVNIETFRSSYNFRSWKVLLSMKAKQVQKYKIHIQIRNVSRILKTLINYCFTIHTKVIIFYIYLQTWMKNIHIPQITSVWHYSDIFYFCFCSIKLLNRNRHTTKFSIFYLSFFVWTMTWRSMIHLFLTK